MADGVVRTAFALPPGMGAAEDRREKDIGLVAAEAFADGGGGAVSRAQQHGHACRRAGPVVWLALIVRDD